MLHKIFKGFAPVLAVALAFGATACDGKISINGEEGVALSELDLDGKTPTGLVLAGQDTIVVSRGDTLAIDVDGDPDAVEALRFTLDSDSLGVMRRKSASRIEGTATVRVTLPRLTTLVVAGSGTVEAFAMSGGAETTIAGSGTARVAEVDADTLEVTIAGSGKYIAAGSADRLELTVAGSGNADMAGLAVKTAEVTIAGSGDAAFASDGTVSATVMGSGNVTVEGSATCTMTSMGSGSLRCSAGTVKRAGGGRPKPPTPPAAPAAPTPE